MNRIVEVYLEGIKVMKNLQETKDRSYTMDCARAILFAHYYIQEKGLLGL